MYTDRSRSHRFWDFIEQGDFEWPDATLEERIYFRQIAAAFLRATFPVPEGYIIDVLEAQYGESRFPMVALGWNQNPEPLSLNEREELVRQMVEPLIRFVQAVEWQEVARIRAAVGKVPGLEDLKSLLLRHAATVPLAQRCLNDLSDPATKIHLAPKPLSARDLHEVHAERSMREQLDGRIVESSAPLVAALARMAEAGRTVGIHSVETTRERFSVITDPAMEELVLIQSTRDDRARIRASLEERLTKKEPEEAAE